ncbi:MAG: hypothetical protein IKH25_01620 [Muribaculaceae bacterium]|nr:hypothetical protein [Muribaculaceae bacterium]
MRSKDLAKAAGLAVAFDHTAPTFYWVSLDPQVNLPRDKKVETQNLASPLMDVWIS